MKTIAIINQKGGVGKTTTSANLSAALAKLGKRVAVVDLDPQANLSVHLGVRAAEGSPSIYHLLLEGKSLGEILVPSATENLRVAPSNLDLAGAEVELVSEIGRETRLKEGIEAWVRAESKGKNGEPADFVVIDCPPSLGLLSVNGLVAATDVYIAVQTEFFALRGLTKLLELVELVKRRLNPNLEISGIVAGLYDARRTLNREVLAELRSYFGSKVFQTVIRENVRLAEAPSHGQSIFDYAPESHGAADYLALAKEVVGEAKEEEKGSAAPVAVTQAMAVTQAAAVTQAVAPKVAAAAAAPAQASAGLPRNRAAPPTKTTAPAKTVTPVQRVSAAKKVPPAAVPPAAMATAASPPTTSPSATVNTAVVSPPVVAPAAGMAAASKSSSPQPARPRPAAAEGSVGA